MNRALFIFKRWLNGQDYARIARELGLSSGRIKHEARIGAREATYMALLIKYMAVIWEEEGIDYLDTVVLDQDGKSRHLQISESELEELQAASRKAKWYLL